LTFKKHCLLLPANQAIPKKPSVSFIISTSN